MKTSEILLAARELIAVPERWIKGEFYSLAIDGGICFCILGAIREADPSNGGFTNPVAEWAINKCLVPWFDEGVAAFNDAPETTHADVMTVFDKAIEKAKEEENGAGI